MTTSGSTDIITTIEALVKEYSAHLLTQKPFVSADISIIHAGLMYAKREFPEATSLLDMGSGIHGIVALSHAVGFDAFGFEGFSEIAGVGDQLLADFKQTPLYTPDRALVGLVGNYFSPEYLTLRQSGEAQAIPLEVAINKKRKEEWDINAVNTVSAHENLVDRSFSDFDLIYSYPWRTQTPGIVEQFVREAKDDAKLLFYDNHCFARYDLDKLRELGVTYVDYYSEARMLILERW